MFRSRVILLASVVLASAAYAQNELPLDPSQRLARLPQASVGTVGERLDEDDAPKIVRPLAAVASRVQNRVQSRLRNRIDRFYDPQANAQSPFIIAADEARVAGRRRRR
jgi:hypothetical protein